MYGELLLAGMWFLSKKLIIIIFAPALENCQKWGAIWRFASILLAGKPAGELKLSCRWFELSPHVPRSFPSAVARGPSQLLLVVKIQGISSMAVAVPWVKPWCRWCSCWWWLLTRKVNYFLKSRMKEWDVFVYISINIDFSNVEKIRLWLLLRYDLV